MRKYQSSLTVHQVLEKGQQEVILLTPLRWYDDRGDDNWEEGYNERLGRRPGGRIPGSTDSGFRASAKSEKYLVALRGT